MTALRLLLAPPGQWLAYFVHLGYVGYADPMHKQEETEHGGTLHLRGGSLPARQSAAIHSLLSLPLGASAKLAAPAW